MALPQQPQQGLRGNSKAVRDLVRKHAQDLLDDELQAGGYEGDALEGFLKNINASGAGQRYFNSMPLENKISHYMSHAPFGEFTYSGQRDFLNTLGLRNNSGREFGDDEIDQRYRYYVARELSKLIGERQKAKPVQFGNDLRPIK